MQITCCGPLGLQARALHHEDQMLGDTMYDSPGTTPVRSPTQILASCSCRGWLFGLALWSFLQEA